MRSRNIGALIIVIALAAAASLVGLVPQWRGPFLSLAGEVQAVILMDSVCIVFLCAIVFLRGLAAPRKKRGGRDRTGALP